MREMTDQKRKSEREQASGVAFLLHCHHTGSKGGLGSGEGPWPPHTRKRSPPARETAQGQLRPSLVSGPTPGGAVFCSKDNEAVPEAFFSDVTISFFLKRISGDGNGGQF